MSSSKSDLMLHEGLIVGHPHADSIAVGSGRIMACGRYSDLMALVGPGTHLIRLGGRAVAPGLIDSHLHFLEAASSAAGVTVSRAGDIAGLLFELRQAAARTAPGNWLRAFGCDESLLKERRGPTRQELDQAVPKQPLRLRHQTLHGSWLNSRAITLLGLEGRDFTPPAGGRMWRDANQRLTGLVTGMEEWLSERLPPLTVADLEARVRSYSRELAAAGVTSFTDATVRNGLDHIKLFGKLTAWGAIVQHVALMLGEDHLDSCDDARRIGSRAGVPVVAVVAVKFRGRSEFGESDLNSRVESALNSRLGCAFHATEIEEVEAAISALESARIRLGRDVMANSTFRIEHGGVITPDQISRIAALNAWVVTNPGFIFYRGAKYLAEPGLIPHTYRCRSLAAAGIRLAGGTDAPVTPAKPLVAIAAAAARLNQDGRELAPEERIDLPSAYRLFSAAGAELIGRQAGTIAVGMDADLVVFPRNPMEVPLTDLPGLPVEMTIIGGQVVYERGRPAAFTGIPDTI
jgi:predicted amidohydrolase YtcJ